MMHVRKHACNMNTFIDTRAHHKNKQAFTYTHTHASAPTHTQIQTDTHENASIHEQKHTQTHDQPRTCTHARARTHTHTLPASATSLRTASGVTKQKPCTLADFCPANRLKPAGANRFDVCSMPRPPARALQGAQVTAMQSAEGPPVCFSDASLGGTARRGWSSACMISATPQAANTFIHLAQHQRPTAVGHHSAAPGFRTRRISRRYSKMVWRSQWGKQSGVSRASQHLPHAPHHRPEVWRHQRHESCISG